MGCGASSGTSADGSADGPCAAQPASAPPPPPPPLVANARASEVDEENCFSFKKPEARADDADSE